MFYLIWIGLAMLCALPESWYAEGLEYWGRVEIAFFNIPCVLMGGLMGVVLLFSLLLMVSSAPVDPF